MMEEYNLEQAGVNAFGLGLEARWYGGDLPAAERRLTVRWNVGGADKATILNMRETIKNKWNNNSSLLAKAKIIDIKDISGPWIHIIMDIYELGWTWTQFENYINGTVTSLKPANKIKFPGNAGWAYTGGYLPPPLPNPENENEGNGGGGGGNGGNGGGGGDKPTATSKIVPIAIILAGAGLLFGLMFGVFKKKR